MCADPPAHAAILKNRLLMFRSLLQLSFGLTLAASGLASGLANGLAHAQSAKPGKPVELGAPAAAAVDPQTAVQKANAYLNSSDTYIADFTQVAADGKKSEGKLYVQRPGRLRFEYARPSTLEIVADGTSISVRDRKLATNDLYFIKQTPLKFLLKENVDLAKDTKIVAVEPNAKNVVIAIEDKVTFGGTSRIKLVFDAKNYALRQWQVTDPQGYETLVTLHNIDYNKKPDPNLFVIDQTPPDRN
jgi:outer membrane lipoprotein-sorting protein